MIIVLFIRKTLFIILHIWYFQYKNRLINNDPLEYISNEILHELTYVMKFENTIPFDAAVAVDLAL